MNIHLPAILGFTRYQGFDPSPVDPLQCHEFCRSLKPPGRMAEKVPPLAPNTICAAGETAFYILQRRTGGQEKKEILYCTWCLLLRDDVAFLISRVLHVQHLTFKRWNVPLLEHRVFNSESHLCRIPRTSADQQVAICNSCRVNLAVVCAALGHSEPNDMQHGENRWKNVANLGAICNSPVRRKL